MQKILNLFEFNQKINYKNSGGAGATTVVLTILAIILVGSSVIKQIPMTA